MVCCINFFRNSSQSEIISSLLHMFTLGLDRIACIYLESLSH